MVDAELTRLSVDGVEVARYVDGTAVTDPRLSPRPYLHPVRTLGGTEVTDCMPDDHAWHLGVSVAVQDVGGVNFWGGRTYVRGQGYVWRDDHGVQRHQAWQVRAVDHCVEELGWYAPDGRCLLAESRSLHAAPCDVGGESAWVLSVDLQLHNVSGAALALGSPATNGRVGAGYGGLFWRLPRSASPPRVFSTDAAGESAVHGCVTPWLAWTVRADAATAAAGSGTQTELASLSSTYRAERRQNDEDPLRSRPYTVVLAAAASGEGGTADPWFVRVESYPGVCSAWAFEEPAPMAENDVLARSVRALIADAALDRSAIAAWLAS